MSAKALIPILSVSIILGLFPDLASGQSESVSRQQKLALRKGGIRAAAKVTGHFVGPAQFHHERVTPDLEGLARFSTAVVVGDIRDNRCRLSADGHVITTDYNVTVVENLKGSAVAGSMVVAKYWEKDYATFMLDVYAAVAATEKAPN